ncbi:putative endonuclease/exonuclease/phosphatase family protein [Salipiger mucosus DSM 16094]|uniref:Putative endonuclease/exonuclease/phosphatase family protein n=1 Tax=Salipiger mucosus DSM 16094 TaxID=1123237 RepID=S9S5F5_9RHOB|nr:putative endonuclease/exonuclease/phosphatase family protein [Salipiger mucosus DSM 16094]
MVSQRLAGALTLLILVLLAGGLLSHLVGREQVEPIVVLARLVEGARPHMLVVAALLALALPLLGAWRSGVLAILVALAGLGLLARDYRAGAAPVGQQTDLTVLWFNLLEQNPVDPERLEAAFRDSGADVIALTEAGPALPAAEALSDHYPYRLGCIEDTHCGQLILSRHPLTPISDRDFRLRARHRLIDAHVDLPGGQTVRLLSTHLFKPWYLVISHAEHKLLHEALREREDMPTLVTGDFNSTPWSRDMLSLERRRELRHAPAPVSTWPVGAGDFGAQIDHVLLRGGPGFVSLAPWGEGLGSNHRGLLARIDLDPDEASSQP